MVAARRLVVDAVDDAICSLAEFILHGGIRKASHTAKVGMSFVVLSEARNTRYKLLSYLL